MDHSKTGGAVRDLTVRVAVAVEGEVEAVRERVCGRAWWRRLLSQSAPSWGRSLSVTAR